MQYSSHSISGFKSGGLYQLSLAELLSLFPTAVLNIGSNNPDSDTLRHRLLAERIQNNL